MAVLSVNDTLHFGRHNGRKVSQMIVDDASYACWLREEKKRQDSRDTTFDPYTNALIDKEIGKSRSLMRKYKPWNLPMVAEPSAPTASASSEIKGRKADLVIIDDILDDQSRRAPALLAAQVALLKQEQERFEANRYAGQWGEW